MARPSKLTPLVQERIVKALQAGAHPETAARYAGTDRSTYYRWLERGDPDGTESRDAPYREFRLAVEQAEAEAELRDVGLIAKAGKHDWRAVAWRLERRHRERWGRAAPDSGAEPPREGLFPPGNYHLRRLSDEEFGQLRGLLELARSGHRSPPSPDPAEQRAKPALPTEAGLWWEAFSRELELGDAECRAYVHEELRLLAEERVDEAAQLRREFAARRGLPPPPADDDA